ncbi:MAG: anti-sigma factor antagonist [Planctomycetota bacterium]
MADLTLKTQEITEIEATRKVGLAGAIDASTVIKFQAELDKLKNEEGVRRFLLDMEGIRYVNSTGLGSLVKLADGLEREGGIIALMRIHPKVKVVFDMLGLNAFFKIFDDDKSAIEYLKTAPSGPLEEEPPAPEPEPIPEPLPAPEPEPVPEPEPIPMPMPPAPEPIRDTGAIPAATEGPPAAEISCGMCGLPLSVKAHGDFRCPRCFHVFSRSSDGAIEETGRKKPIPVQMTLTGSDTCIEGFKRFVEVMAEDQGFKEKDISKLREAITETFQSIIELAYDRNPDLSFQVLLTGEEGEITIRVADHGKVFDMDDHRFASVQKIATEFSHVPHPNGGNIVRLTKKI